jgi:DNA-binding MarR family transcriptional regulator
MPPSSARAARSTGRASTGIGRRCCACWIGALAERLYLHISTVSGVLDRLEERGLAARVRAPEDRRVVRLKVTAAGVALLKRVPEPPRSRLARGVGRLTELELRRVRDALGLLARLMGADRIEPALES